MWNFGQETLITFYGLFALNDKVNIIFVVMNMNVFHSVDVMLSSRVGATLYATHAVTTTMKFTLSSGANEP